MQAADTDSSEENLFKACCTCLLCHGEAVIAMKAELPAVYAGIDYFASAEEHTTVGFLYLMQWFSNFLRCDTFKKACETLRRTRQHPTV